MDIVVHLSLSLACGGLEKVIVNLVNASKRCKHVVVTLHDDNELASLLPEDVELYCLNKKAGKDLGCHLRFFSLMNKLKPTVLHTYNFSTIEYHWIAKLTGIKKQIHSDHGFGGQSPDGNDPIKNVFRNITTRLFDEYVVVSQDLKNWAINKAKITHTDIKVVFNGVDVPFSKPNYPQRNYSKESPFQLTTVGRLHPIKNQVAMIDAMASIKKMNPDIPIHLNLVGEGSERSILERAISENNLNNDITLHGMQFNISEHISNCDAFILSSLFEAMPMTVLEAMAMNRPVICTDVGGVSDFITSKEAMLIPGNNTLALTEAILSMFNMKHDGREALSERGFELTKSKYSIERMVGVYEDMYIND